MLRTFIDELRIGKRERSVVSIQTTGSLSADEKEAWRQLRKELESVGITPVAFAQNRAFIVATLQKAIIEEGLAGDIPCAYDFLDFSDSGQETFKTSSTPGVISSAEPNVKPTDELLLQPIQQPIQGRISSNKVPNIDSPRRSTDVGRMARLLFKITNSKTTIIEAAARGDAILVERLLDKGANVDSKRGVFGGTLLWRAAKNGHEAVVELLLDKGVAVDSKGEFGGTPLWGAAKNGHEAVVKLLLDKGAAVDSKGEFGGTPLWEAAANGHEAVVKLLLDKGAAVDSKRGVLGRTPLWEAAANGHEAVAKLLLDKGVAVDSKGGGGGPPLWEAAANGHEAVVKLLLDKGAAVDLKGGVFRGTPLWAAKKNGHKAVVELLLDKGAASLF
jgi:ankyrin repeat protein